MTDDKPTTTTLDMDRIARGVVAAGFAAYVEQTGGGVATVYASREWETIATEGGPVRLPAAHLDDKGDPRFGAVAGPGWFEGEKWTDPRASSTDFYVSRDDDGQGDIVTVTTESEAVGAIVDLLDPNARYKTALGGTPASFLLKDEGDWYKGEDYGVWVKVTRKQAAAAAQQNGEFLPPDIKAGDFVRIEVQDPAKEFGTVRATPPYLTKRRHEVVIS